jgi:hypothetical protein
LEKILADQNGLAASAPWDIKVEVESKREEAEGVAEDDIVPVQERSVSKSDVVYSVSDFII